MRFAVVLCLLSAACTESAGRPQRQVVTLWHSYSGDERAALEELADKLNSSRSDLLLQLVAVPYDAFPDKITAAVPNGNGPDLFIYAHDRIGDWAEASILEPVEFFVDEALADRFELQAITAMAYRGSLYGLPLAVKSLALFYRTDLVASPPATTDELLALGHRLTDRLAGRFGLVYENVKLYHHAPWLHGFGGRIWGETDDLAILTPQAAAALAFARELGGPSGIVPSETTGALVGTLFQEGRAAMAMSGPWFVGGLPGGVPWAVTTLPVVSATGLPAAPFLGAEGVMMSARARDKRSAFTVMEFLTSDEAAIHRAARARQVVANRAAAREPRVSSDRVLAAFRRQAETAVPMPSKPAMRMVWTPYDTAIQRVVAQGADPYRALADCDREVRTYAKGLE